MFPRDYLDWIEKYAVKVLRGLVILNGRAITSIIISYFSRAYNFESTRNYVLGYIAEIRPRRRKISFDYSFPSFIAPPDELKKIARI